MADQEVLRSWQNPWTDRDVEEHWDRVAHMYVDANRRVEDAHDQRFAVAVGQLNLASGQQVLNVTSRDCGAVPALEHACDDVRLVNAEISRGLMEVARELHPQAIQQKIDTYSSLPFSDREYDAVLSLETLEHVENPVLFLSELLRVCRPGGRLVLSCPPATAELSYRVYTRLFGGHGEGPHRFPSSRRVKHWLQLVGWKLEHHAGTLLIPAGPKFLRTFGEWFIQRVQGTPVAELGIRQFYVCHKQSQ